MLKGCFIDLYGDDILNSGAEMTIIKLVKIKLKQASNNKILFLKNCEGCSCRWCNWWVTLKYNCSLLIQWLHGLFKLYDGWIHANDRKNGIIVPLYKRKGSKNEKKYFSRFGKMFSRILIGRIEEVVLSNIYGTEQHGCECQYFAIRWIQ